MSPDARGSLRGGGAGELTGPEGLLSMGLAVDAPEGGFGGELLLADAGGGGVGLCFMRKSRRAPRERDAMAGSGPRKRSSSEWYDMLSAPVA